MKNANNVFQFEQIVVINLRKKDTPNKSDLQTFSNVKFKAAELNLKQQIKQFLFDLFSFFYILILIKISCVHDIKPKRIQND